MKYTCSAGTEIFDFIGQIFPETDDMATGDAVIDEQRKQLKAMGGINYENVSKLLKLPDLDDMDYDPAGVYEALTGTKNETATVQDCMRKDFGIVTDKIKELSKPAQTAIQADKNIPILKRIS